jgi:hypothetical protein
VNWSVLEKELEKESDEWVDLGLPSDLKWAAWNMGATKPEEYGLYFAWGETQGYADASSGKGFCWGDYKFHSGHSSPTDTLFYNITKYNAGFPDGTLDMLTILRPEDDAAYQSDNTCRMPTYDDFEELLTNTTSTWETLNGINGRRFTSKTNGNSIFIPAAGRGIKGSLKDVNSIGTYWSNTYDTEGDTAAIAQCLRVNSSDALITSSSRCIGYSVRAVKD